MAKLWPAFLRGHIFTARKDLARAAAEFQHVIDRRSESADSLLYPMALLGRARVAAAAGDTAAAERYLPAAVHGVARRGQGSGAARRSPPRGRAAALTAGLKPPSLT